MPVAFVFPGQGSQAVGMGQALAQAYPEARAVLDEADAALGGGLLRLLFEGPEEELRKTANTQPAILAVSIAAHRDRKSTRLNSSHSQISYAVFCLKKKTASA